MPQVYQPQKKDNSAAFTVLGAGIGAMGGSPMAGASAGQMVGGLANKPSAPTQVATQESAMSRRYNAAQDDPLLKLQESQAALAQLSPDLQKQYKPAIDQATVMEQQRRGLA